MGNLRWELRTKELVKGKVAVKELPHFRGLGEMTKHTGIVSSKQSQVSSTDIASFLSIKVITMRHATLYFNMCMPKTALTSRARVSRDLTTVKI